MCSQVFYNYSDVYETHIEIKGGNRVLSIAKWQKCALSHNFGSKNVQFNRRTNRWKGKSWKIGGLHYMIPLTWASFENKNKNCEGQRRVEFKMELPLYVSRFTNLSLLLPISAASCRVPKRKIPELDQKMTRTNRPLTFEIRWRDNPTSISADFQLLGLWSWEESYRDI